MQAIDFKTEKSSDEENEEITESVGAHEIKESPSNLRSCRRTDQEQNINVSRSQTMGDSHER